MSVIELLVCVAIIGMLALLGAKSMMQALDQARSSRAISEMRMLSDAINQLAVLTGRYPNGPYEVAREQGNGPE